MQKDNNKKLSYKLLESISFVFIWLGILIIPLFTNRVSEHIVWDKVIISWIIIIPFLLIFIVNVYLLIPIFLHKKQYTRYILALIVITPLILCTFQQIENYYKKHEVISMPPMEIGPGMPPMEFSKDMPPPKGYRLKQKNTNPSTSLQFLWSCLIALFVIGNGTVYKVILFWFRADKERKQLEQILHSQSIDEEEYIFVKADYKMVKIRIADILYIESANEYIKIWIDKDEVVTTFMRLKNIESTLPATKFMRVQRSFIIHLEKIKSVEKNRIFIDPKKSIPIGEQYKERFQQYLGKNFIK